MDEADKPKVASAFAGTFDLGLSRRAVSIAPAIAPLICLRLAFEAVFFDALLLEFVFVFGV
jgi:hypothetical protein